MTLIDPVISLAFSMHDGKGIYALLLGSGVSRAAGITTGWEVVLDLIRKVAHLQGENCEPDPANWYRRKFDTYPHYARLLEMLASSPTERSRLLRTYFEPNDEEREQGLKTPTEAHRAVAELVANGYIRVIVTTNFDRLLEQALENMGVTPTVISTPDAAEGAVPLTHATCSIVKVHGDYLDTRIKNTPEELAQFDERINALLNRIFDDFGLIVCGWSAEWDTALRAALERCQSHRFTTYWASLGDDSQATQRLIALRSAQRIQIRDADTFFRDLAEKVIALEEYTRPHPLSTKAAIARAKRYLLEERYQIRLHDLVMEETERVYGNLSEANFPVQGVSFSVEELKQRLTRYEASLETLTPLLATGCYWGTPAHQKLWVKVLERIGNPSGGKTGLVVWLNLRLYPALLLLYASGLAAVAADKYSTLAALLTDSIYNEDSERIPLALKLVPVRIVDNDAMNQMLGKRFYTPVSEHLSEVIRAPLREFLPDDVTYEITFDRFECLFALIYADFLKKQGRGVWGPVGRFGYKLRNDEASNPLKALLAEAEHRKESWGPFKAGLFEGDYSRFEEIATEYTKAFSNLGWW
jgi:hypothetical protein